MIKKNGFMITSLKGYLTSVPVGFVTLSMEVRIYG